MSVCACAVLCGSFLVAPFATTSASATGATHFVVTVSQTTISTGVSLSIVATAVDSSNAKVASYTGTVHFSSSDASAFLPADYTFTTWDAGTRSFTAWFATAGNQTVGVKDKAAPSISGISDAVTVVAPGPATHLSVFAAPGVTGQGDGVQLTALDASGNIASGYRGTVHITSADTHAVLAADVLFTASDAGRKFVSSGVVFGSAGSQTVTAKDVAAPSISGSTPVSVVTPGPVSQFLGGPGSKVIAGTSFSSFETTYVGVFADDSGFHSVSGYRGTVHFTSSDPAAILPPDYTFRAADAAYAAFPLVFKTLGPQSLTIQDATNGLTKTWTFSVVSPGSATHLLTSSAYSRSSVGANATLLVGAQDANGFFATGYRGTVQFSASDTSAGLPASYTFTSADNGFHSFPIRFTTSGRQTISIVDTANTLSASTATWVVAPGPTKHLTFANYGRNPVLAPVGIGVNAVDVNGDVTPAYSGSVAISPGSANAVRSLNGTFTAADHGARGFLIEYEKPGTPLATASDVDHPAISGSFRLTNVQPGPAARYVVSMGSSASIGSTIALIVDAVDAVGRRATGYQSQATVTSTDALAKLPARVKFINGHGFGSLALGTSGTQQLTVTSTRDSSLSGSAALSVSAPQAATHLTLSLTPVGLSGLVVAGGLNTSVGAPMTAVIRALDANGNLATRYRGTVHFTSTDPSAALPADYTFTASDNGTHLFSGLVLQTPGADVITATDVAAPTLNGAQTAYAHPVGALAQLAVAHVFNQTPTHGVSFSLTVTAVDTFGDVLVSFTGSVSFTSSDAAATLPTDYSYVPADGGVHSFSATFGTTGIQTISSATASASGLDILVVK